LRYFCAAYDVAALAVDDVVYSAAFGGRECGSDFWIYLWMAGSDLIFLAGLRL
jgi:hypothetical protein